MKQSRRDFLKKLPLAMSIPFTLGGISMRVMAQNTLTRLAAASTNNSRVLVILQMAGGNDGLNCCIPVKHYADYYNVRPNIAIPAANSLRKYVPVDSTLPEDQQFGFHPDMLGMKSLYDQGRMAVVQGVSYKNNNGSHFRGRDIWFMGGSYDDYLQSGWMGRYLQEEYSPYNYPDDFPLHAGDDSANPDFEMIDPLAIEIGSDSALLFHQKENIPTSFSLPAPGENGIGDLDGLEGFFENQNTDPRGAPPEYLHGTPYYKELEWILALEDKTQDYTERLIDVYNSGVKSTVTYPSIYPFNAPSGALNNPLSTQLKLIARLLASPKDCKTKIFLVKMGGFDTHADQVEKNNPTMGGHAALMYHISTAMRAFQDDLKARGIEDRVLTITTSEFGRRIKSNASYGTDHGTAAPMFIFGKGVKAGVIGNAYEITDSNNLAMQKDYRVVYANIMRDWMLVNDDNKLNKIFPGIMDADGASDGTKFEALPIAQQTITSNEDFIGTRFSLEDCYPNPAKDHTTITFRVNSAYQVNINLFDNTGQKTKVLVDGVYTPGEHKVEVDLKDLPAGNYIYELKTGFYKEAKKLIVIK